MSSDENSGELPSLGESLTDAEYDRLAAILHSFTGEDAMDLEEMDGFFAALICGPVTVAPSVYLDEMWGGEETPFGSAHDVEEFFNLAMRHWNSIGRELGSQDMIFVPWLEVERREEIRKGNCWAQGFLRGIALCREEWDEVFADEDKFAMLLPVMALAHEHDPDPEMRPWKTPPDDNLREGVITGLAVSAQKLYDYFRPHRIREAKRGTTPFRRTTRKIGRNEPCSCGSGEKYKHCCGNATIN
jgi:uncharacterized protein